MYADICIILYTLTLYILYCHYYMLLLLLLYSTTALLLILYCYYYHAPCSRAGAQAGGAEHGLLTAGGRGLIGRAETCQPPKLLPPIIAMIIITIVMVIIVIITVLHIGADISRPASGPSVLLAFLTMISQQRQVPLWYSFYCWGDRGPESFRTFPESHSSALIFFTQIY